MSRSRSNPSYNNLTHTLIIIIIYTTITRQTKHIADKVDTKEDYKVILETAHADLDKDMRTDTKTNLHHARRSATFMRSYIASQ